MPMDTQTAGHRKLQLGTNKHFSLYILLILWGGGSRGVMAYVLDSCFEVNELALHSRYYVHFQTNTFRKGMNPLIPTAMG